MVPDRSAKSLGGFVERVVTPGALKADRNCDEDGLVAAFASFGVRSRVPTLWLYAENDSFFGPGLVRRLHGAYTREGGAATLAQFGPLGNDGHKLWDPWADTSSTLAITSTARR